MQDLEDIHDSKKVIFTAEKLGPVIFSELKNEKKFNDRLATLLRARLQAATQKIDQCQFDRSNPRNIDNVINKETKQLQDFMIYLYMQKEATNEFKKLLEKSLKRFGIEKNTLKKITSNKAEFGLIGRVEKEIKHMEDNAAQEWSLENIYDRPRSVAVTTDASLRLQQRVEESEFAREQKERAEFHQRLENQEKIKKEYAQKTILLSTQAKDTSKSKKVSSSDKKDNEMLRHPETNKPTNIKPKR